MLRLWTWMKAHKDWSTALVLVIGLLLFSAIARMNGCSIQRQDEAFDKAEAVKVEEINRLETEADTHVAAIAVLQNQIATLEIEKRAALAASAKKDARIAEMTRSKNALSKQLEQDLRDADVVITPLERCRNACERAKQLGLIDANTDCHCK